MVTALALILLGYLVGSIPTGYWAGKVLKGIDIRECGSGSTGATNALRVLGKGPALLVLVVDIAKGYLPVCLAAVLENNPGTHIPGASLHVLPPLVALASLIGHSKSVFLKFTGGKSAATALGTLLALNLAVGTLCFAIWCFLVWSTRYVSIASMVAGILSGVLMALFRNPASYVVYCAAGATLVLLRHKSNIKRLLSGTEPRIGEKAPELPQARDSRTPEV